MRPGQQNNNNKNRQRGRNNNGGRKHLNPLSRNYESNGPDVKVRGNAAHIAEKYVQLARDAHTSGDSVMAENYLQHAEHYYRILSAAQPQPQPQRLDQAGQVVEPEESDDDFIGDEQADRFEITPFHQQQNEQRQQSELRQQSDRQQNDRPQHQQFDRNRDDRNRDDRNQQGDRPRFDNQQQRTNEQPRFTPPPAQPQQQAEASAESGESPETLVAGEVAMEAGLQPDSTNETQGEPRRRERRPRRRRPQMAGEAGGPVDPDGPQPEVGDLPAFITAGGTPNPAE